MRLLPRPQERAPEPDNGPTMARVIAFANQKGGVAKTTTTLNLGVAFAEKGKRVLLADLDPQGNLTMSQGWNPDEIDRSMFDVLVHRLPISEITATNEIDVAVASIDLAGAEMSLSSMIGRERALDKALQPVQESYDYILIDTPPSLGLLTINAFVAAQGVIVPVQCEYLSLRGLVQLENTLTMIRENLNPDVAIQGILPTMFDKRLLHSREAVEILRENFGDLVLQTKIKKTVRYAEAPVKGQSIFKYDPSGEAAFMYRQLAKEVLDGASARACVRVRWRKPSSAPPKLRRSRLSSAAARLTRPPRARRSSRSRTPSSRPRPKRRPSRRRGPSSTSRAGRKRLRSRRPRRRRPRRIRCPARRRPIPSRRLRGPNRPQHLALRCPRRRRSFTARPQRRPKPARTSP